MIKCSKCGNEVKEGTKFCSKCGNNILEQQEKGSDEISSEEKQPIKKCANCGNEIGEGTLFCPKCGSRITADNNQKQFSEKSQQNTDGASREEYKYTRPEKVRFSERWLLLKLFIISFFLNPGVSEAFASLADMEYAEAFGVFLVSGLLLYWLYRNYRNYAGNPYMLKFGLKDETIVSISKKIKVAEKVVDFILTAAWIITGITYIGDTGVLSLTTWVALPAAEVGPWVIVAILLIEADYMILSHRPYQWAVDREIFDDVDKED